MSGLGRDGGGDDRDLPTFGDKALYLIGVALVAACITVVWLGMRAVMEIGGSCASGGPYEVAVPCPAGLDLAMILAFPLGFLGIGTVVWKGARLGAAWVGVAALAWPALFLGLGWNFVEYGIAPPGGGGMELGWLIPGVLFLLMGGVPLLAWVGARGDTPIVPGVSGTRARSEVRQLRDLRDAMAVAARTARRNAGSQASTMTVAQAMRATPVASADMAPRAGADVAPRAGAGEASIAGGGPSSAGGAPAPPSRPTDDLVDQLERLAALHRDGSLNLLEFQAAKAALLAAAAADGNAPPATEPGP